MTVSFFNNEEWHPSVPKTHISLQLYLLKPHHLLRLLKLQNSENFKMYFKEITFYRFLFPSAP